MKKLMIAFAAVAMAACAQASTFNWSAMSSAAVFNGYDAPSKNVAWTGATAQKDLSYYLVYANASGGISQSALLSGLRDGNTMADYSKYVLTSGTTGSDGKIAKATFTTQNDDNTAARYFALDGSGKQSAYYVVIKGDDVYIGGTSTLAANTAGGQADYSIATATSKFLRDDDGKTAYGSAGWYSTSSVPEPTSGLLLLLGMAGLALRRRRA